MLTKTTKLRLALFGAVLLGATSPVYSAHPGKAVHSETDWVLWQMSMGDGAPDGDPGLEQWALGTSPAGGGRAAFKASRPAGSGTQIDWVLWQMSMGEGLPEGDPVLRERAMGR